MTVCRGIKGATTVERNTREDILAATTELLQLMVEHNDIDPDDVASALFTTTADLNAEFPAVAARRIGWTEVPLCCAHELDVPGSLRMCLRILLHINTDKAARDIVHIYHRGAKVLRPDLVERLS
ncbi:MAG TPA: chorismate mutase [Dehalococcoidia bacterium]